MKLSTKQKEVIRLMREGAILERDTFWGERWTLQLPNGMRTKVNSNTGNIVIGTPLISFDYSKNVGTTTVFKLSEQGKTIEL